MILSVVSKQTTDIYIKRKDLIAYESVIEYFIIHTPLRFTSACPSAIGGQLWGTTTNHFHGGIDIKTEREVNLGVYAIADGYISGAVVEKHGYGRAILVTHPNGYTSCYVHLNRFAPQIEAAVRKWQYQHQQFACDVKFRPGEFPVKKGQFIALSGNTGSSQGPHIHLEMHKTANGNLYDPLTFLKSIVKDKTAPAVYSFKNLSSTRTRCLPTQFRLTYLHL